MKNGKKVFAALLSALLSLCLLGALATSPAPTKVKIGVVGENNAQWEVIIPMLAKEGIEIELVKFNDYTVPNQALADGEIDLNAFQHYNFMNKWSKEHGVELKAIGETLIAPLAIYSEKIKSLAELKDGDGIAIVNDVVNEARALRMLEAAGLIKLKPDITELATVADIAENPHNYQLVEMDASLTAAALKDPAIAVGFLNGNFAKDAGYSQDRALLVEKYDPANPDMHGIINIIAARADRADEAVFKRIVEAYHTPQVREVFDTVFKGVYIPAWQ